MSGSRTFRRGGSISVAPLAMNLLGGLLALNGIGHLFERQWLWGAVDLLAAVAGWFDVRWAARTPIIEVADGELVIRRHSFLRPRRVRLAAITGVDDSRPALARVYVQGGGEVRIPLHWIEWDDRAPFVAWLKSLAGEPGPANP